MENILQNPQFDSIAGQYENSLGLPSGVLRSLIYQESRGNPKAISPVGAQGVAQFMPGTAKAYNVNVTDPWDSLRGAAEYLGDSVKKYGTIEAALAEYNGGPRQAQRVAAGQAPAAKETANYIPQILSRMQPGQAPKADQAVMQSTARGDNLSMQVQALRDAGYKDWIADAKQQGASNEEIVQTLAAQGAATGQAAHDKRAQSGFIGNAVDGLMDTGQRVARGAQQIVASGDDLTQLQAQEAADRANPDKIALRSTAGATVGSAAPYVAAAFIPGVNGVVGGTALGATMAALQPTVAGESRTSNAALGGLTGGAGVLAGKALGGAINASTRGAQNAIRGGRSVQEVADTIKTLEDQGIQVSARDISPFLNRAANSAEDVMGSGIGQADRGLTREQQLSRALTRRMGQESDTLDSDYISAAQNRIGKQFDDALAGVHIDGTTLAPALDNVIANQQNGLASLQSSLPTRVAQELKDRFSKGPMAAEDLQGLRSMIGKELTNPSLAGAARQGLSDINTTITQAIEGALPAANADAWKLANQQWRNLQAAENMVRASNDTGDITARQLASAIKTGKNRSSYERGVAPYQDIQRALSSLQDGSQGLVGSQEATAFKALGAYATGGASLIGSGITANIALRLLNSTNPRIRSMLLGMSPVKQAELRRIATAGALAMNNTGAQQ